MLGVTRTAEPAGRVSREGPRLLTLPQVAERLNVDLASVRALIADGTLRALVTWRELRVVAADVDAYRALQG